MYFTNSKDISKRTNVYEMKLCNISLFLKKFVVFFLSFFFVISPTKNGMVRYLCYSFHFFTVSLSFSKVYKVLPYIQSLTKIRTKRI